MLPIIPRSSSAPPIALTVLLLASFGNAQAEGYAALTYGSGPDGYRSFSLTGDIELAQTLRFGFDHFLAQTPNSPDTRETGASAFWAVSDLAGVNYRHSEINDGTFAVSGNTGNLSLALNTLWQGELQTSLNLGYGSFKYKAANPQTIAASNFVLTQEQSSLGLSQEISSILTLYGSHDQYKYDRNVRALAIFLLQRARNTSKAAFSLLAFPDKSNTLGMGWKATNALNLDVSFSKTTTLLDQQLKNARLGLDYQAGDSLNLGIALTRSTASAMVNGSGVTVQPETRDNYWELTAGWLF